MLEKCENSKYNGLTRVFICSPCPACTVSWLVYGKYLSKRLQEYVSNDVDMNMLALSRLYCVMACLRYLSKRLQEYVSNDVDMNIETKFREVIFEEKVFMCINYMSSCLTRYVHMKILNTCFINNLPDKICSLPINSVYQNSARTDYSLIEIIHVFQLFTVRNQNNKWRF